MTNTDDVQWKRTAAEGVAIVVSILLAFWIDTWWEDRKEARLEVVYLLELREDFEQNKSRLEKEIASIEETTRSMIVLQEQSALDSPSMSVSELNENFSQIINMTTFYPINRAYELSIMRQRRLLYWYRTRMKWSWYKFTSHISSKISIMLRWDTHG